MGVPFRVRRVSAELPFLVRTSNEVRTSNGVRASNGLEATLDLVAIDRLGNIYVAVERPTRR